MGSVLLLQRHSSKLRIPYAMPETSPLDGDESIRFSVLCEREVPITGFLRLFTNPIICRFVIDDLVSNYLP